VASPKTALGSKDEAFATIRDPAGNLLGIYHSPNG